MKRDAMTITRKDGEKGNSGLLFHTRTNIAPFSPSLKPNTASPQYFYVTRCHCICHVIDVPNDDCILCDDRGCKPKEIQSAETEMFIPKGTCPRCLTDSWSYKEGKNCPFCLLNSKV